MTSLFANGRSGVDGGRISLSPPYEIKEGREGEGVISCAVVVPGASIIWTHEPSTRTSYLFAAFTGAVLRSHRKLLRQNAPRLCSPYHASSTVPVAWKIYPSLLLALQLLLYGDREKTRKKNVALRGLFWKLGGHHPSLSDAPFLACLSSHFFSFFGPAALLFVCIF